MESNTFDRHQSFNKLFPKIEKPTQMSGFILGGPLGPKFELFLFCD